MVAIAVLLLDHAPPLVASVKEVDAPGHKTEAPAIAAGLLLTVTGNVALQPATV